MALILLLVFITITMYLHAIYIRAIPK